MNITVNIQAPELVQAINSLAAAMQANAGAIQNQSSAQLTVPGSEIAPAPIQPPTTPAAQDPVIVPTAAQPAQVAPNALQYAVQPPQPVPTTQPNPAEPTSAAVPTATQTYTLDQLAVAATQLMDAGRQPELIQLLNQFGVKALMELPKEQYGAFATALRQMGAKI